MMISLLVMSCLFTSTLAGTLPHQTAWRHSNINIYTTPELWYQQICIIKYPLPWSGMAMVQATLSSTPPILLSIQPSTTSVDPTFHMLLNILKILPFDLTSHVNTIILSDSIWGNTFVTKPGWRSSWVSMWHGTALQGISTSMCLQFTLEIHSMISTIHTCHT